MPRKQPQPDSHAEDLTQLAMDYAKAILGEPLQIELSVVQSCCDQLDEAVAFHQQEFREADKRFDRLYVVDALRRGEFAYGERPDCDLLADFFLARFYGARIEAAARAFVQRFGQQIRAWARRYGPNDTDLADSILADLLLPRKKSGPRIDSYKARGPLDGWLRQVVWSQADRRRAARGIVVSSADAAGEQTVLDEAAYRRGPACALGPEDAYAARDCFDHLGPLFRRVIDGLPVRQRAVLRMVLIDGVPQKRVAQLLRLPEYTVSRMKTRAVERVAHEFFSLANKAKGMDRDAVQACLALILEAFPGSGIELPPSGED